MKNAEEVRYPHSAELFRFCKDALGIKHKYEIKVIDQHVGAIVGYEPADCSHWKNGRRNIRSIDMLSAIGKCFDVDPRFIGDIAAGRIDYDDAISEYAEQDLFVPIREEKAAEGILRSQIVALADELILKGDVRSCPVHLHEIVSVCGGKIALVEGESPYPTVSEQDGVFTISVASFVKVMRRFLIAREIGRILLSPEILGTDGDALVSSSLNTFALHLLVPTHLLHLAVRDAPLDRDLVHYLSEVFWVSRSIVVIRLKDYLSCGN